MKNRIQIVITPRIHNVGGTSVRRVLPFAKKRMVGPFIFLDHLGPQEFDSNHHVDVWAHPHIGLSTLTYLFSGNGEHKDSLGNKQNILPGDVNWMTSGKGIAHVERIPSPTLPQQGLLHSLQFWVALPDEREDMDPIFVHVAKEKIPEWNDDGLDISLVVGEACGRVSPVPTESPTIFMYLKASLNKTFAYSSTEFEVAVYPIQGEFKVDGVSYKDQIVVFGKGSDVEIELPAGSQAILIGGKPFTTERHIWWNFVSSSQEKIKRAEAAWADGSFPEVEGESKRLSLPTT